MELPSLLLLGTRRPGDWKIDQTCVVDVVEVEGEAHIFDLRDLGELPYTQATEPR